MLIPRVYYRVGEKGCFKTEAAALLEAQVLIKASKETIIVDVFKCVRMEHDESSMLNAKEDSLEWRIDDVIEGQLSIPVNWKL